MANGTFGTKKPAQITSNDIDIFYNYRPTRNSESSDSINGFKQIDSNLLQNVNAQSSDGSTNLGVLPGMYDLKLPVNIFGRVGFYTIYIKPKEIRTNIIAVSNLAAYPNIRGIVLDTNSLDGKDGRLGNNGELIGFRIEYFDNSTGERLDTYRLITSNNKCTPVTQNLNDSFATNIKYAFNDSSNLTFCTLTPSSSMSFNSSAYPFIGEPGQEIALINTKFNPVMFDIEITEHDIETITTMLEGDQLRNLDAGIITTFNKDGGVYHQAQYGTVVDKKNGYHHDYKINTITTTSEEDKLKEIKEASNNG